MVPCARGQKIFLRPHQRKLQSLKIKIGAKACEEATAEHLLFITSAIFRSNKICVTLEMHALCLQPPKANVGSGTETDAAAILQLFSKKYACLGIFC